MASTTFYNSQSLVGIGSVGIGTTNPTAPLHISTSGTGGQNIAYFLQPSIASGGTNSGVSVGGTVATGGCGFIGFLNYGTNTTNVFQLSSTGYGVSAININGTGVGIGTTNPAVTLDVYTGTMNAASLSLTSTPVAAANVLTVINTGASGNIAQFSSSSGSAMIINNTGNVGFGTASPGRKVECTTGTSGTAQIPLRLSNYNTTSTSKSTTLEFSGTDTAAALKQVGLITAQGYNGDYTTGGFLSFSVISSPFSSATTAEYMRISSAAASGQAFVGIGTTASVASSNVVIYANTAQTSTTGSFPLVISADTAIKVYNSGSSTYAGDPGQGQLILCGATTPAYRLGLMMDTTNHIGLIQSMQFGTGTLPLCLNAAPGIGGTPSNVGIGTTNPQGILHVDSISSSTVQLLASSLGSSTKQSLFIGKSATSKNSATLAWNHVGDGGTTNYFGIGYYGSDNLLNVTASGNVGIGTTNPQGILHVDSISSSTVQLLASSLGSSTKQSLFIGKSATSKNSATLAWNHVGDGGTTNYFGIGYYGSDNLLNVTASGNVGIGLTNPSYALDIYNSTAGGNLPFIRIGGAGGPGNQVGINLVPYTLRSGGSPVQIVATDDGNASAYLTFLVAPTGAAGAATERMRITTAGNVGIATTIPTCTLHVNSSGATQIQTGNAAVQIQNGGGLPINMNYVGPNGANNVSIYSVSSSASPASPNKVFRYLGSLPSDGNVGNLGSFHIEGVLGVSQNSAYLRADFCNRSTSGGYKYSQLTGGTVDSNMNVFMVSNTASTNYDLYVQYGNNSYNGFNFDIKAIWSNFLFTNIEGSADPRLSPTSYATAWDLIASANFVQRSDRSGNVGIGTTNPGAMLTVGDLPSVFQNGKASITKLALGDSTVNSSGGKINIYIGKNSVTSNGFFTIYNHISDGSSQNYLNFQAYGFNGAGPCFQASGNVGIGTTNPTRLLQVWGSSVFGTSSDVRAAVSTFNVVGATTTFSINADISDGGRTVSVQCPDGSTTTSNLVALSLQVGTTGPARMGIDLKGFRVASQGYGGFCVTSPFDSGGAYDLLYADRAKAYFQQWLGLGLMSPGYQLDLSTDGARKLTTTTWLTGSDQRIKTDIQSANLHMCYDTVKSIDLKYFKWNFPESSNVSLDDNHSLGFIAQEVKTVFPNAVSESNSHGYSDFLSLNTDQILKAMYGALKQTMADKEDLEVRLETAQNDIDLLETRLAALESLVRSSIPSPTIDPSVSRSAALLAQAQ